MLTKAILYRIQLLSTKTSKCGHLTITQLRGCNSALTRGNGAMRADVQVFLLCFCLLRRPLICLKQKEKHLYIYIKFLGCRQVIFQNALRQPRNRYAKSRSRLCAARLHTFCITWLEIYVAVALGSALREFA